MECNLESRYMLFPQEQQIGLNERLKWQHSEKDVLEKDYFRNKKFMWITIKILYIHATNYNIPMKHRSDKDSNSVKKAGMPIIQCVEQ